jgi:predicted DNA-binding transcriptional regulator
MLETEFARIGLNENEREVYLAVLKAGKTPVHRVARLTGINRTTIYSIARKLIKLGLISEDLGAKVGYLVAEKPDVLTNLFQKEEKDISERKKAAEVLARELLHFRSGEDYSVPRIKFIEEADLTNYLYKQYPVWAENGLKYENTWWGYHDNSFTEEYGKWIDWCWRQGPEGLKVRFFTNEAPVEEEMGERHPNRLTKTIKEGEFDSSLWLIGDYTIMIRSRERPHYLVEINDTVLARNQRQLFKSLWDSVK